jgi:hypothetical protein
MRFQSVRHLIFVVWLAIVVAALPGFMAAPSFHFAGQVLAQAPGPGSSTAVTDSENRSTPAPTARKKDRGSKETSRPKNDHGFTPEREAAALTFVKQYHPELAKLLAALKTKERQEYCRAVRDLFRHSERLAVYREKYPERYDLELRAWQIKSRIQLVAARLRLSSEDACLREELKKSLVEQADVRIELLRQERKKMAERLEHLDDQIDEMQQQRELVAEKQLQALLRTVAIKHHPKQKSQAASKEGVKRPAKEKEKDNGRPKATKPLPPTKPANRE